VSETPASDAEIPEPQAETPESETETPESDTGSFNLEFRGSALGVMPLHLFRLFALAALCVTLPFGLGRSVIEDAHRLFDPLGFGEPWRQLELAVGTLPFVGSGVVSLLLVVLFVTAHNWIWHYRLKNTWVHGEPIDYQGGCSPFASWASICLVLFSWGLLAPWVLSWSRRRLFRRCETRHGPLGFSGSGLGIASYGLLSMLSIPLTFLSFGLAWVLPRYLWLKWEQDNLVAPDVNGQACETEWEGSLVNYLKFVLLRWVLTLLTLGLLHPLAMTATWRWAAEHTRFTPKAPEPEGPGLRERLARLLPGAGDGSEVEPDPEPTQAPERRDPS
jgi:hypothetical protein